MRTKRIHRNTIPVYLVMLTFLAGCSSKEPIVLDEVIVLPAEHINTKRTRRLEQLARNNPKQLLQQALDSCLQLHSYSAHFIRTERLKGRLTPTQVIEVRFRDEPFSVYMNWLENPQAAQRILYVQGRYDNQILVRPSGLAGFLVVRRRVDDPQVLASSRYPVTQFGFVNSIRRLMRVLDEPQTTVSYLGRGRVGQRETIALRFTRAATSDPQQARQIIVHLDTKILAPLAVLLQDGRGRWIGRYIFVNLQLNPKLPRGTFSKSRL